MENHVSTNKLETISSFEEAIVWEMKNPYPYPLVVKINLWEYPDW